MEDEYMTPDEKMRRDMIDHLVPEKQLATIIQAGERIWNTEAMKEDFLVTGFLAPLVYVTRRSDGAEGVMMFTHRPRYYFNFVRKEILQAPTN